MLKNNKIFDHISPKITEKVLENFAIATGIGVSIINTRGEQISHIIKASKLCDLAYKNEQLKAEIQDTIEKNINCTMVDGRIKIFNQYFDTYTFLVPIFLEGRISSFFISELARFGNPDIAKCKLESEKLNIDLDTFLDMYLELPLLNMEKFEASANMLKSTATTITGLIQEKNMINEKFIQLEEEKKELENKLKSQIEFGKQFAEQFQTLFNNINDGAYIRNLEGTILDINRYGARLLGYEPKEVIGRNIVEAYSKQEDFKMILDTILEKGFIKNYDSFARCKDNTIKHLAVSAIGIKDATGKIVGIQGIFHELIPRVHQPLNDQIGNELQNTSFSSNQNNKLSSKEA